MFEIFAYYQSFEADGTRVEDYEVFKADTQIEAEKKIEEMDANGFYTSYRIDEL